MAEVKIANDVTAVVGMPVRIVNNQTLSHNTRGAIAGFRKTAGGKMLVMVKWLDNAPPISVKPESVHSLLPRKFWMIAGNMGDDTRLQYLHDSTLNTRAAGHNAPRRRFYSREEVDSVLDSLHRQYPNVDWIVFESETFVTKQGQFKI